MADLPHLSNYVLAPYIKSIDENTLEATVHLPSAVEARLRNENFNRKIESNESSKREVIYLIPTHSNNEGEEVSIKDLVKKDFDNQAWRDEVEDAMKESGLIQNKTEWVDDRVITTNYRNSHDGFFTVRIDNLPEGYGSIELTNILLDKGCEYFDHVVVPKEDQTGQLKQIRFKRFGFIKFNRLRYAIKFLEDYNKIMEDGMVLNVALVV